jgi:hypothetical protein
VAPMPVASTKPPHHWQARARDLHKLAALTDDGPLKTAMSLVENEYGRLAQNSVRWQVGNRVSRKDSLILGTIVAAAGQIKIKWDGGRTSHFRRDKPANVKLIPE